VESDHYIGSVGYEQWDGIIQTKYIAWGQRDMIHRMISAGWDQRYGSCIRPEGWGVWDQMNSVGSDESSMIGQIKRNQYSAIDNMGSLGWENWDLTSKTNYLITFLWYRNPYTVYDMVIVLQLRLVFPTQWDGIGGGGGEDGDGDGMGMGSAG
jgi:hypothetical protein